MPISGILSVKTSSIFEPSGLARCDWLLEQIGNLIREGEVMKLGKNKTEPMTWLTKEEVCAWWFRTDEQVKEIPFDNIEGIEPKDYYDVAEELHNDAVEFQQHLLNEEEVGDDA